MTFVSLCEIYLEKSKFPPIIASYRPLSACMNWSDRVKDLTRHYKDCKNAVCADSDCKSWLHLSCELTVKTIEGYILSLWVAFLSHFDFSLKTINFRPFIAINDKKNDLPKIWQKRAENEENRFIVYRPQFIVD